MKSETDDKNLPRCRACLSTDRRLQPVGNYSKNYRQLLPDEMCSSTCFEDVLLCWECHNQLRKAAHFQKQVRRASELIKLGQSYIYGTLSSLTTVVINEVQPHTIYEAAIKSVNLNNDNRILTSTENDSTYGSLLNDSMKKQEEDCSILSEKIFANDDNEEPIEFDTDFGDKSGMDAESNEDLNTVKTHIVTKDTNKKNTNNKWAKIKALQNKKPKFKILAHKDLISDKVFTKTQLNIEQFKEWMKSEKEKESYRMSKYKCEDCVVAFNDEKKLIKHNYQSHVGDKRPYTCDVCNTRFPSKKHISGHMKCHYVKYQCCLCQFSCYGKENRRKHLSQKHRKTFQCLRCELKFCCRRDFFKHYKEWHEKFICDHCGIGFKMRYCIKDHLRKAHSTFECKPCGKRFARYNGLWLHNKVRHSPPAPAAYCVECDKHYPDIYRYRWHLANSARHNPKKKRRIPCPNCEKVFSKNIYMKDHYNLVHLKQYNYRCEECDKNFIRNADLVKHKKRTHEGILPPKNKICYICGKGFTTNKILSNHVRTHTGERPHACPACPARFAQRTTLRGHARAHHPPAEV